MKLAQSSGFYVWDEVVTEIYLASAVAMAGLPQVAIRQAVIRKMIQLGHIRTWLVLIGSGRCE
ncbi:MAG TPA: hypothetical protein VGF49_17955 [Candidatus Solibacter sp.]